MTFRFSLVGALLVLAGLIGGAAAIGMARVSLQHGIDQTRAAETELRSMTHHPAVAAFRRADREVTAARGDFRRADALLAPLGPVLSSLGWVPRVGKKLAAAPAASDVAYQAADGAASLLHGSRPLIDTWASRSSGKSNLGLPRIVTQLAAGHADFVHALAAFNRAQHARRSLHAAGVTQITSSLHTFDVHLPGLIGLSRALMLAPRLLGYGGPQTYLVAYQDPLELRATGGFIGAAGLLTVRSGHIAQQFTGTWLDDNLSVPPPDPVQLYNRETAWLFRDSNWSPDFPTSAALERFFLGVDLHRKADGVLDVTPAGASAVLTAIGPIYVPEYHRFVTASNVGTLADFYAHWSPTPGPGVYAGTATSRDTHRKQFIGIVAHYIIQKLGHLPPSHWSTLADQISSAMARGDILMNFQDPTEQSLVRWAGATGGISHSRSDYLYVVDDNLSYNKINAYVHVAVTYRAAIQPNRWVHGTVSIRVRNDRFPVFRPSWFGPGAGRLGHWDDYADYIRVIVPAGAALLNASGWTQQWSTGNGYGKTIFGGYLIVRAGAQRTVTLNYLTPPNIFSPTHGRSYRLVLQHQPGNANQTAQVNVTDGARSVVSTSLVPLQTDKTLTGPITNRPFNPIPLPRNPYPRVAPGQWIEPHAYLSVPR